MYNNKKIHNQFLILLIATGMNLALSVLVNILLTRVMTEVDFGFYRYVLNIFNGLAVVVQLGIPYTASFILTRIEDTEIEREVITFTTNIMFFVSLISSFLVIIALLFFSFFNNREGINILILLSLPFAYTTILQIAYKEMLKGANKIIDISIQTVFPNLLFIIFIVFLYIIKASTLTFSMVFFVYVSSFTLVHLNTYIRSYNSINKEKYKSIWFEFKDALKYQGRPVFIGSIVGVASVYIINIFVGNLLGYVAFGTLSLALSLAQPIQLIPATMGTILFKSNATQKKLGAKNLFVTIFLTAFSGIAFAILLKVVFPLLFPASYIASSEYTVNLIFSSALYGLGDYFNRFLGAKGKSKIIRNAATISGLLNLIFSVYLLPRWGINAIVVSRLIASLVYCFQMIFAYLSISREELE